MKKLLITDLDDTLYGWLDFFVPSFYAMADEVARVTNTEISIVLSQYKELHKKYNSVEHPFVTLELPCVKDYFSGKTREQMKEALDSSFHAFNRERKNTLKLFEGVYETLNTLSEKGVMIIGYTESGEENGYYRLKMLNILNFFSRVYVSTTQYANGLTESNTIPCCTVSSKKPSPETLIKICEDVGIRTSDAIYIGDSLTKDVYMALQAKVTSVWFQNKTLNQNFYKKLVDITSWTDEDFNREKELKQKWNDSNLKPDYTISKFNELITIILK